MLWELGGFVAVLVGAEVLARVIPPHLWYIVPRKRRAMWIAQGTFAREHPDWRADWSGCWVYQAAPDRCFVFVQHRGAVQPPSYSGYVVWDQREEPDYLGVWQFHWGILPRHAVEWYESRRAAAGGWPAGPIEAVCDLSDRIDGK
jgi:hypothetical protein